MLSTRTKLGAIAVLAVALLPRSGLAQSAPDPVNGRVIGGIAVIGVAGASLAVGIVSTVQVVDAQKEINYYRHFVSTGEDVCSNPPSPPTGPAPAAPGACSKAVFVPLQFVFYPLSLVAGGFGAYLLATSSPKPRRAAAPWVIPAFGPGHATMTLGWQW
jgi:hypothetical protein